MRIPTQLGSSRIAKVTALLSTTTTLSMAMLLGACSEDQQPLAPGLEVVALETLLYRAIQDEYHAESVYQGVLADFGEVRPFSNIIQAEERHSAAIAQAYESRGWAVPVSEWSVTNVPRFESVAEACRVGAEAEVANVEVYDDLLQAELPEDVVRIFVSNRGASLERHLPAFQRCS
mgnify:CR=1 FL=1